MFGKSAVSHSSAAVLPIPPRPFSAAGRPSSSLRAKNPQSFRFIHTLASVRFFVCQKIVFPIKQGFGNGISEALLYDM